MAPIFLIALGVLIYFLNRNPDTHIALRGLPWLNVPAFFVVIGVVSLVLRIWIRRRARARAEAEAAREAEADGARDREDGPEGGI